MPACVRTLYPDCELGSLLNTLRISATISFLAWCFGYAHEAQSRTPHKHLPPLWVCMQAVTAPGCIDDRKRGSTGGAVASHGHGKSLRMMQRAS